MKAEDGTGTARVGITTPPSEVAAMAAGAKGFPLNL